MIKRELYEQAIFEAIRKGSTEIAPDVCAAFEKAIAKESRPAAKEGLEKTYESIKRSAQITSYCALRNRTELGSGILKGAYDYLKRFPQDATTVFDVLPYFDIINMVSLLKVPAEFFMGLADPICLPHFVYSAYAHANCEKTITMYPFTPHEVPSPYRRVVQTELTKML